MSTPAATEFELVASDLHPDDAEAVASGHVRVNLRVAPPQGVPRFERSQAVDARHYQLLTKLGFTPWRMPGWQSAASLWCVPRWLALVMNVFGFMGTFDRLSPRLLVKHMAHDRSWRDGLESIINMRWNTWAPVARDYLGALQTRALAREARNRRRHAPGSVADLMLRAEVSHVTDACERCGCSALVHLATGLCVSCGCAGCGRAECGGCS